MYASTAFAQCHAASWSAPGCRAAHRHRRHTGRPALALPLRQAPVGLFEALGPDTA